MTPIFTPPPKMRINTRSATLLLISHNKIKTLQDCSTESADLLATEVTEKVKRTKAKGNTTTDFPNDAGKQTSGNNAGAFADERGFFVHYGRHEESQRRRIVKSQ